MDDPTAHPTTPWRLLHADEPDPVGLSRRDGASPFFLTCDHASRRVPARLRGLGLSAAERRRHIGWDIGALSVAQELSRRLDATLVWQNYSRLVVDCNRQPHAADWVPQVSEQTVIEGNRGLSPAALAARREQIYQPYQDAISAELDRRAAAGRATALIAVHSFTPVYRGDSRPWQLSLMYDRRAQLCRLLQTTLAADAAGLVIGVNEPYRVDPDKDCGIPLHGDARGLPNLQFEIRQDLIGDARGQKRWGERLARWLEAIRPRIEFDESDDGV